jgi:hypothetical protein
VKIIVTKLVGSLGYHGSTAPDYLVYPVNWCQVDTQFIPLCRINPPISADNENAILTSVLAKLKEIHKAAEDLAERARVSISGEIGFDGTSHDVRATYGEAPDIDLPEQHGARK